MSVDGIVRVTEFGRCVVECLDPETNTCPLVEACRFRAIVGRALEAFGHMLDGDTPSDLLAEPEGMRRSIRLADPGALGDRRGARWDQAAARPR